MTDLMGLNDIILIAPAEPEEGHILPKYSDIGRILVEYHGKPEIGVYRYEIDVYDYDGHSSVMWISEGTGFEYWIDCYITFEEPGMYVIEGICGSYYRGTRGIDDDDEDWEHSSIRKATATEIETKNLDELQVQKT